MPNEFVARNGIIALNNSSITGSLGVSGGITGSLLGTASYALFALTASYINQADVPPLFQISTGSITASVDVNPTNLFLIKSGSTQYFNISSSGNVNIHSNLFIIKNFTTQQPVFTVSQSIVQFATQSTIPTGTTNAGSIWFTSASMYIGLEG